MQTACLKSMTEGSLMFNIESSSFSSSDIEYIVLNGNMDGRFSSIMFFGVVCLCIRNFSNNALLAINGTVQLFIFISVFFIIMF